MAVGLPFGERHRLLLDGVSSVIGLAFQGRSLWQVRLRRLLEWFKHDIPEMLEVIPLAHSKASSLLDSGDVSPAKAYTVQASRFSRVVYAAVQAYGSYVADEDILQWDAKPIQLEDDVLIPLRAAINWYKTKHLPEGCALDLQLDASCPQQLSLDAGKIIYIAAALLTNSVKAVRVALNDGKLARGADASIRMTVSLAKHELRIRVEDNGAPIDPHFRESMFLPGMGAFDGTGLGLSIARQLVEAGHGRISVEEKSSHKSFIACIPVNGAAARSRHSGQLQGSEGSEEEGME